jgi:hypothetical protein
MSGQKRFRPDFAQIGCLSAAFIIALVLSGCPDPIRAIEDIAPVESPELVPPSGGDPESPPEENPPAPSASVEVADPGSLKAALQNPDVTAIEIAPGTSLTIGDGVEAAGASKSLRIPAGSMVTVSGLQVPEGVRLSFYRGMGNSASQLVLNSLNVMGELSVFSDIYTILDDSKTVTGKLHLQGGTFIVRNGSSIQGSGGSSLYLGGTVLIPDAENNFYDELGVRMKPPAGAFSWVNGRWEASGASFPPAFADFLRATEPVSYVVKEDDVWPPNEPLAAAGTGEKTLFLPRGITLANVSLTLNPGARLKLSGEGTLKSTSTVLDSNAELEVDTNVTFKAGDTVRLGNGGKFIVRGSFYDAAIPGWAMDQNASFESRAGSKVYTSADDTGFFIGGENSDDAVIALKSGRIVLTPQQFRLEGNAQLNKEFSQWNGGIYINGELNVKNRKLTVEPTDRLPYFELARGAIVKVENGGTLTVNGEPIDSRISYARLGENSKILVERGGTFKNNIFPNWKHEGPEGGEGAFIFEAGSKIYAPANALGVGLGSSEQIYISDNDADSPVVKLTQGRIRLSDKTFALEGVNGGTGEASLEYHDLTLSGAKLVLKDSNLTIEKKLTVTNDSGDLFVSLNNANIFVEDGGEFEITGPASPGNTKLARLDRLSTIEVKNNGTFRNGIYDNWENNGKFIFKPGSKVYKNNDRFIGGSSPLKLTGSGSLVYDNNKITLENAEAEVSDLSGLPLWPGFSLVIGNGGGLTVNVDTPNTFTLDGLAVTVKGGGKFTLKGGGTLTMKNRSTVTVNTGGTFTNYLYDNSGQKLKVTYEDDGSAFIIQAGGTATLGKENGGGELHKISRDSGSLIQLTRGTITFNKTELNWFDGIVGEMVYASNNFLTIKTLLSIGRVFSAE